MSPEMTPYPESANIDNNLTKEKVTYDVSAAYDLANQILAKAGHIKFTEPRKSIFQKLFHKNKLQNPNFNSYFDTDFMDESSDPDSIPGRIKTYANFYFKEQKKPRIIITGSKNNNETETKIMAEVYFKFHPFHTVNPKFILEFGPSNDLQKTRVKLPFDGKYNKSYEQASKSEYSGYLRSLIGFMKSTTEVLSPLAPIHPNPKLQNEDASTSFDQTQLKTEWRRT